MGKYKWYCKNCDFSSAKSRNIENHKLKCKEIIIKRFKSDCNKKLTDKKNMLITIFTVCDFNYFKHFELFAKSYIINETNKEYVKYKHFFIYKNDEDLKLMKEKILDIFCEYINFEFVKYEKTSLDLKCFCNHFRFKGFRFLFENDNSDIFIYSDVDALINKSIYERHNILKENAYFFLRINKNNDIIVNRTNFDILFKKHRINKVGKTHVLGGVIILKNNEIGKNLLANMLIKYNKYEKSDKLCWQTDQFIFDDIFWSNKFKIGILDRVYFDLNLNDDNILFLCKGNEFSLDRKKWEENVKKTNIVFDKKMINYKRNF